VLAGDKVEMRPVVPGDWIADRWFIDEGLKGGERVVVDGGMLLAAGMTVSAKPLGTEAAPAQPDAPAAKP
jgi:membrane fusion protein (multidrug efflux system)